MKLYVALEGFVLSRGSMMLERIVGGIWYVFSVCIRGLLLLLFECARSMRSFVRRLCGAVREIFRVKVEPFEMFGMGLKFDVTDKSELVLEIGLTHLIIVCILCGVLMRCKAKGLWFISYIAEYLQDARRKLVKISRLIKYKEKGVIPLVKPLPPRTRKEKRR